MKRKLSYLMMVPAFAMTASMSFAAGPALEEVFVTATKTETTEMETPLSIEAFTSAEILKSGLSDMSDMALRIPSVNIGEGLTASSINIRGMGSGQERSFEQSVAMFIDGVYMPRSRQYRAPFFDIARAEVLRGPQAVTFGLNATAGTVNVTTNTTYPGDDTTVKVIGTYESEYDGSGVDVMAGTSVGDTVGVRLALRYKDTGDGITENVVIGEDENYTRETLARATIVWQASDELEITSKINYAEADEYGNTGELFSSTAMGNSKNLDWVRETDSGLTNIFADGRTGRAVDKDPGFYHDVTNVAVTAEYELEDYTLVGTLSYSNSDYIQMVNTSAFPFEAFSNVVEEGYEQIAGEFRIESSANESLTYMAGIYVAEGELESYIATGVGAPLLGFAAGTVAADTFTDTTTISPFINATWHLSDTLRLITGMRYSHEEKEFGRERLISQLYANTGPGAYAYVGTAVDVLIAPGFDQDLGMDILYAATGLIGGSGDNSGDRTSENFMPEVVLQWDYNDSSVAYAKVSKSAKSGGFSYGSLPSSGIGEAEYDDEEAVSAEIGIKTRMMDDRAELNVAVFRTEFEDLQLNTFVIDPVSGAPQGIVSNAGKSIAQGIEVEFNFAATDWLIVGTSVGYLDSEFDEFDKGPCNAQAGVNPGYCDLAGEDTPYSPEYSGAVYADMDLPITDELLLTGGLTMSFSDSYYTEGSLDANAEQSGYERVDANIGLASSDDTWAVSIIGKNLNDKAVNNFTQPFIGGTYIGYPSAPKTITLQGVYNF